VGDCKYSLHKTKNQCAESCGLRQLVIYYYRTTIFKYCVWKVGLIVTNKDIAKRVVLASGGIAKMADLLNSGLAKYEVNSLIKVGYLERVHHGFYKITEASNISEARLLASLLPEGIVCVESALFYYGYSDFAPRRWTVAVPRTISRAKLRIKAVPLKAYYIQRDKYELGKTTADFEGVTLFIYDRERTICDCFKYRTKMDNETFNKAINAYVADEKKNLNNLSKYAKKMRLFEIINDLLGVMLNG